MQPLKFFAFSALAAAMLSGLSGAPAQVAISIGAPPICPYGYFDYAPYECAPYGYYGPDWFTGGLFIGAGPWFGGYYGRGGLYGRYGYRSDFGGRGYGYGGRGEFRGNYGRGGYAGG